MTLPPIGEREIIIRHVPEGGLVFGAGPSALDIAAGRVRRPPVTDGGPPGPTPGTPPPVSDWTAEELEDIELLAETEGLDRARDIVKAGRKPPGERERITPTQDKKGRLLLALQAQGITLDITKSDDLNKLNAFYDVLTLEVPPSATWEQYLALPDKVGALYRKWYAAEEAKRTEKEALREEKEALREEKELASRVKRLADEMQRIEAKRQELAKAELNDTVADLKRRYPNNKNLIESLKPELMDAWEQANARQQTEWDTLPVDIQDALGGQRPLDTPMSVFVRVTDLGRFATEQGFGGEWQDGMLKDSIQRQVYDPMLAAAKTPQDKLSADNKIAKLQGSYAGLLRQFNFAQQQDPTLTADAFMAGAGSDLMAQMQANNQATLNDQIKALAAAGKSRAQIAAQLTLGPGDFVSSADALRQGELIAEQIKRGQQLQAAGETRAAMDAYLKAIASLPTTQTGSPDEIARMLGTTVADLQRLNPDFFGIVQNTAASNRQFNLLNAQRRQTTAETFGLLQRAVAVGAFTKEEAEDALAKGMVYTPEQARQVEELIAQATIANTQRGQAIGAALGAAQNLSENARYLLRMTPAGGSRRNIEATLAQVRQAEGENANPDWRTIGELEAQVNEAALFEDPEFMPFLEQRAEGIASRYASDLARRAQLQPGQWPDPSQVAKFSNIQEYTRTLLPQIGAEFAAEKAARKKAEAARATATRLARPVYGAGVI